MEDLLRTHRFLVRDSKKTLADLTGQMPIDAQISAVSRRLQELRECHAKILAACDDDAVYDAHQQNHVGIELELECRLGVLRAEQNSREPQSPVSLAPSPTPSSSYYVAPMPQMKLPSFDGKITNWTNFSQLFKDGLSMWPNLTQAQKLMQLKNCIQNDAQIVVRNIPTTDENCFDVAWKLLKDKYSHQREITYNLSCQLLDLPSASTPKETENIVDKTRDILRSLALDGFKATGISDALLGPHILRKVPEAARCSYTDSLTDDKVPSLESMLDFLQRWAKSRADFQPAAAKQEKSSPSQNQRTSPPVKCQSCEKEHPLYRCKTFLADTVEDRWKLVRKTRSCSLCLSSIHGTRDCKSNFLCKRCSKPHNSLLHYDNDNEKKVAAAVTVTDEILLATAELKILDRKGKYHSARALIDPGSQVSLISTALFKRLRLRVANSSMSLTTAVGQKSKSTSTCCTIASTDNKFKTSVTMAVVDQIADTLPSKNLAAESFSNFCHNKTMADPNFMKSSAIDLLLGCDVYGNILLPDTEIHDGLVAQSTKLGWIMMGKLAGIQPPKNAVVASVMANIHRFWEIEDIAEPKLLSKEEKEVEEFAEKTTRRDADGKFIMTMPLTIDATKLGASRHIAVSRLRSLELRFKKDPAYKDAYSAVINEYIAAGHCEQVKDSSKNSQPVNYMPHHAVIRDSASTTKLRVVFDASSKTTSGISLNDCQANGPRLQPNIFDLLIRFRWHAVAVTCDIKQMYRQIWLNKDQQDLQRFLWRPSLKEPVKEYRLTTVCFGQRAAPYMATKALQFAGKEAEDPETSRAIVEDFYIDDLLTGASNQKEARRLVKGIETTLKAAGFPTHKWASNYPEVLQEVQNKSRESVQVTPTESPEQTALGIIWATKNDELALQMNMPNPKKWTRRSVLSAVNSIYDPLGFASAVTISAKMILQSIVANTKDWDEPLSPDHLSRWTAWYQQLKSIQHVSVPRRVSSRPSSASLCVFSDASEKAFCAVVYMRTETENGVEIRLVAAKTRVAPLKPVTLPRLELMGALLAARLVKSILAAFPQRIEKIYAFTDSTITLSWILADPSRWQTFVAHRVNEIQQVIPSLCWQHVISSENPADLATRGISPEDLINSSLWWQGPSWLLQGTSSGSTPCLGIPIEEKKTPMIVAAIIAKPAGVIVELLTKFSSFRLLRAVVARLLLYMENCKKKRLTHVTARLMQAAAAKIYRVVQQQSFPEEMSCLEANQPVKTKSRLASLNPFLDKDGVIRVGGRLKYSLLSEAAKHPVVLPSQHHVTKIIIEESHERNLHVGPTQLGHLLRQTYWILHGQSAVKRVTQRCSTCVRFRGQAATQMMANLPSSRVRPVTRPFTDCGVDFAGPLQLKTYLSRGNRTYKAYIALFICFATRAIHIELVTALSSAAFLAAFHRFASRRGVPTTMHSDRGTNFVGASRALAEILAGEEVQQSMASSLITWQFNPPSAPHFGGLWEAGVKSVKYHLHRIVGNQAMTYEEMNTILCQIEAILNSRPLLPMNDDPDSLEALTPGHFLIGDVIRAVPTDNLVDVPTNHLQRWDLTQKMVQQFWSRWSQEYLARLQQRPRWWRKTPNLKVGDLVLIKDENSSPMQWRMGRIIQTHPGDDGAVRVVTVRTSGGELQRPIHKLIPLPLDGDENSSPSP